MGGMRRIADQDQPVMVPALTGDALEIHPGRAAEVGGIALQAVTVEIVAKELLTEGDRLFGVIPIQAMGAPRLLPRFHDDRRKVLAELVGMDLEPAVLGPLESKGKGRERLGGSQPDVAAFAPVDVRLEYIRMTSAGAAVDAIGGDDQIRVRKGVVVFDLVPEVLVHAQSVGALLQDLQQLLAADSAEAMARADQLAAAKMDGNIVPVMEIRQDGAMGLGVGGAEVPHRLVGKHHAPPERIVRPIALIDLDPGRRHRLAQQNGRVEARGTAAQTDDSLHTGGTFE